MAVTAAIETSPGLVPVEDSTQVTLTVTNGNARAVAIRGVTPFATPVASSLGLGQPALPMWTILGPGLSMAFAWGVTPHSSGVFNLSAKVVLGTKEEIIPDAAILYAYDRDQTFLLDGLLDAPLDAPLA